MDDRQQFDDVNDENAVKGVGFDVLTAIAECDV